MRPQQFPNRATNCWRTSFGRCRGWRGGSSRDTRLVNGVDEEEAGMFGGIYLQQRKGDETLKRHVGILSHRFQGHILILHLLRVADQQLAIHQLLD